MVALFLTFDQPAICLQWVRPPPARLTGYREAMLLLEQLVLSADPSVKPNDWTTGQGVCNAPVLVKGMIPTRMT